MSAAVIVQARWASTRLAGKALAPLGGASVLARVLARCAAIPGVAQVVCAVPDGRACEPVGEEAAACGAIVIRGPEHDVLARYAKAASVVGAETVLRVTSDCPFVDPVICGRVLTLLHESGADYACNGMPASWPHGLDCEAFPARLLHWADALAQTPAEREHVTPWLRTHSGLVKASLTGPGGALAALRWTVDYPEDLAFARGVFAALGERAATVGAAELAGLCLRRPDLPALNAARVDRTRLAPAAAPVADIRTPPQELAA